MSFQIKNLVVVNEGKAGAPILTGIGFLDHMLDQLNSHAQVGVGLLVEMESESEPSSQRNRWAGKDQKALCAAVGAELGKAMSPLFQQTGEFRFCCPLDEALVECVLTPLGSQSSLEYTLPPYGLYPKGQGRKHIGHLETAAIEHFWSAWASESNCKIALRKIRGDNGHHIVESSFKAFSRALRNSLDSKLWDPQGENDLAGIAMAREAKVERATKETSISVHLLLNGTSTETKVETGIPMLDAFFTALATEANLTLQISCQGDLWVDDHHTAEDVSIAVGQCLTQALGTKSGLNRMWLADATVGQAEVEVTMDLSNRPYLGHNLYDTLGQAEYVDPPENGSLSSSALSCEMLEHVLDSLAMNGRMTVHIVEKKAGPVKDTMLSTAMAFGRALRVCSMVDKRRAGATASSKGTLSV